MCLGGNNWVKQRYRNLFWLDFIGFRGSWKPVKCVFRVDMAYTWQHKHCRVAMRSFDSLQYLRNVFGGEITGWNIGPEAFLGLILLVSEAPESQLKVFFGFIWPTPDSINMVGWPWGHLNHSSIPGMCLVGITLVKQAWFFWFQRLPKPS